MRKSFLSLAVVTSIAVVPLMGLAGCGDDKSDTKTESSEAPTTPVTEDSSSKVSFVSPSDGATVGPKETFKVNLSDFKVDPKAVGKAAEAGHGHIHFSMDNGKYDQPKYSGANGKLAKKLGTAGKYSPSVMPEITYSNLPSGDHTLKVQLANNDHSDVEGATATLNFKVE